MKREAPRPKTREQMMDERAAADFERMRAANNRPFDPALLVAEKWTGGTFALNGQPVTIVRRVERRRKQRK